MNEVALYTEEKVVIAPRIIETGLDKTFAEQVLQAQQSRKCSQIIKAYYENKRDIPAKNGYDLLSDHLVELFFSARRKTGLKLEWLDKPKERLERVKDIIDLLSVYKSIRIKELEIIFDHGLCGRYDDGGVYDLNKKTVDRWIQKFMGGERKRVIALQNQYKQEQELKAKKEKEKQEHDKLYADMRNIFFQIFEFFQQEFVDQQVNDELLPSRVRIPSGTFYGAWWSIWYKRFDKVGEIHLSQAEKLAIWEEQKEFYQHVQEKRKPSYGVVATESWEVQAKLACQQVGMKKEMARLLNRKGLNIREYFDQVGL